MNKLFEPISRSQTALVRTFNFNCKMPKLCSQVLMHASISMSNSTKIF